MLLFAEMQSLSWLDPSQLRVINAFPQQQPYGRCVGVRHTCNALPSSLTDCFMSLEEDLHDCCLQTFTSLPLQTCHSSPAHSRVPYQACFTAEHCCSHSCQTIRVRHCMRPPPALSAWHKLSVKSQAAEGYSYTLKRLHPYKRFTCASSCRSCQRACWRRLPSLMRPPAAWPAARGPSSPSRTCLDAGGRAPPPFQTAPSLHTIPHTFTMCKPKGVT